MSSKKVVDAKPCPVAQEPVKVISQRPVAAEPAPASQDHGHGKSGNSGANPDPDNGYTISDEE